MNPRGGVLARREISNKGGDVPDRENTTGLSNVGFLLNTTDSLLEQRRDFGRGSLGLSCVGTDLLGGTTSNGTGNSASLESQQSGRSSSTVVV